MPIPEFTEQQVMQLYAEIRDADLLTGDMMARNVETWIKNIRAYANLPDGAEARITVVRHQVAALAQAFRQFGQMGETGAVEKVREGAVRAVDDLAEALEHATRNDRAIALGI